ncbi:unnamed protein product [Orchesella dallaii]|uniref:Uncharacterized protein n=1 Tax=Orchesella dallaii TaxID=48710 RepID=A0ABP1RRS2_9HEXA
MERRSGSRNAHQRGQRRAVLPNRVMAARRLSFRIGEASTSRRINRVPLGITPHIPEASRYFSNFHREVEEPRNEDDAADELGAEVPIAELNDVGRAAEQINYNTHPVLEVVSQGSQQVGRANDQATHRPRRKQRQRKVTSLGIPDHPSLQQSMKKTLQFINTAEQEAREISSHRLCASKKIHCWGKLVDHGINLRCTMARVSQRKKLNASNLRVVEKLQSVNENLEDIVGIFRERLDNERKTLRMERGRDSKKRVCCKVCAREEAH